MVCMHVSVEIKKKVVCVVSSLQVSIIICYESKTEIEIAVEHQTQTNKKYYMSGTRVSKSIIEYHMSKIL